MDCSKLVLNVSKTEIIVFGSQHQLSQINVTSFTLGEVNAPVANTVRNRCVSFDSQLTFEKHSKQLISSCIFQIRQL